MCYYNTEGVKDLLYLKITQKNTTMVKTQPRASVYFSTKINGLLDAECIRTKLSKSKLIETIVENYFENKNNKLHAGVSELNPEYRTAFLEKSDDEIIQFILDELKDLRAAIENLEKD